MKNILKLSIFLLVGGVFPSNAQPPKAYITKGEYIAMYYADAVRDMLKTGVPASITMGQGMLESANGNSSLAKNAKNHFGIKCHDNWNGGTYIMDDDTKNECFRKYKTVQESFEDHSTFLRTRSRYAALFELKRSDYRGWCEGLKKAGYATSPTYAKDLIKIIEDNKLYELDKLTKVPDDEPSVIVNPTPAKPQPVVTNSPKPVPVTVQPRPQDYPEPKFLLNNEVPYVVAKKGDTYMKIAKENEMHVGFLLSYNEVDQNAVLTEGQIVYLQPKRRSGPVEFHVVKEGENMYMISQKYAIALKHLYRRNNMEPPTEPMAGTKLWLRGTKPD